MEGRKEISSSLPNAADSRVATPVIKSTFAVIVAPKWWTLWFPARPRGRKDAHRKRLHLGSPPIALYSIFALHSAQLLDKVLALVGDIVSSSKLRKKTSFLFNTGKQWFSLEKLRKQRFSFRFIHLNYD